MPTATAADPVHPDDAALDLLRIAGLEAVGVLTQASNLTVLVDLLNPEGSPSGHRAVYKPVRGERPLADFPPATLAAREVAAYLVSRAGGFDLVPPTVLRDGPFGPGSVQWWVEQDDERVADPSAGLVDVLDPQEVTDAWLPVLTGEGEDGGTVVVAHADDPELRSMAVLDVVLNNADRKGAHLTRGLDGRLQGFDHGLSLHLDDKLRTVLWGWAGDPLTAADEARLDRLGTELAPGGGLAEDLAALVSVPELEALRGRVAALRAAGALPAPPATRYPLPWPLW